MIRDADGRWIDDKDLSASRKWQIERDRRNRSAGTEAGELLSAAVSVSLKPIAYLLALPIRYGYGKQYLWALLFLFFVAPILLFGGVFLYAMWLHPHAYLAHWDAFAGTHQAAARWTWLVRDLSQWMSAS